MPTESTVIPPPTVAAHAAAPDWERLTPEERELRRFQARLAPLEEELADRELKHATVQNELREFEVRYVAKVGRLYAELDEIEADIAEEEAKLFPDDEEIQQRAADMRERARQSAAAAEAAAAQTVSRKFNPPPALKSMYRMLARMIHPDLTTDSCEQERRNEVMAQANAAYEKGNQDALATMLDEVKNSPEMVTGNDTGAELVRVIRQIYQAEKRIAFIKQDLLESNASDLNQLRLRVETEEANGRDILAEMRIRADAQNRRARRRLEHAREVNAQTAALEVAAAEVV